MHNPNEPPNSGAPLKLGARPVECKRSIGGIPNQRNAAGGQSLALLTGLQPKVRPLPRRGRGRMLHRGELVLFVVGGVNVALALAGTK